MDNDYSLRYPIGQVDDQSYGSVDSYSEKVKESLVRDVKFLPALMEHAVENLDAEQLHTPYRPEGWTIHQVVHHVADSHMNAYIRIKLGLTEINPVIKPYDEAAWAVLSDTKNLPVNVSLTLLHALHSRWVAILENITEEQWENTVFHPGQLRTLSLWQLLKSYAWHGRHHVAHITSLRERKGW